MNQFIKVLSHYADFSGRARRKEYWMFVLFNAIFAFVWAFLGTLVLLLTVRHNRDILPGMYIVYLSYYIIMMLPSLAVVVRRLHDTGKSGWMLLVGLIPIAGGIWLFVLMLTAGEERGNRYGPNPKTSESVFNEKAKLKSAGVTLIVASAVLILTTLFNWILRTFSETFMSGSIFTISQVFYLAATVLLLIVGILLLNENKMYEIQGKKKNAIILFLIAVGICFVLTVANLFAMISAGFYTGWPVAVNFFIPIVFYLSVALFAGSLLLSPRNKDLIRNAAVFSVVFSGLYLLWRVYDSMGVFASENWIYQLQNLFNTFHLFLPVAFIVLAGTFLSGEESKKPATVSDRTYYERDKTVVSPASPASGNAANTVFVREDRESRKVWRIYKAPCKADAIAFLSKQQVSRPFFYIVVETPDGNFGKDFDGLYQE